MVVMPALRSLARCVIRRPGDEQHVAGRLDLLAANVAAAAQGDPLGVPSDGPIRSNMGVHQRMETLPSRPNDGADPIDLGLVLLTAAQQEGPDRIDIHTSRFSQLRIDCDLEERGRSLPPGQLRVLDAVPAIRLAHQEVGDA